MNKPYTFEVVAKFPDGYEFTAYATVELTEEEHAAMLEDIKNCKEDWTTDLMCDLESRILSQHLVFFSTDNDDDKYNDFDEADIFVKEYPDELYEELG